MQDRKDAGQEGFRTCGMQDRCEAGQVFRIGEMPCVGGRTGGTCIQDKRDAGLEGCMKGGMNKWRDTGKEGCKTGEMPDRRDARKVGCRTGGMQD